MEKNMKLEELLIEYLKYSSCDGKPIRQELRKQLCDILGVEYSTTKDSINNA